MNKIWWMGIEVESNLPKDIIVDLINLGQKDVEIYKKMVNWHGKMLKVKK